MKFNDIRTPVKFGRLRSSLTHSEKVTYNGEYVVIPPQGEINNVERALIEGELPKGIKFAPYPTKPAQ